MEVIKMIKSKQNLSKNDILMSNFEINDVSKEQHHSLNEFFSPHYVFRIFHSLVNRAQNNRIYSFDNLINDFLCAQKILVKESTFSHYNNIINAHIRPYFNTFSLEEIDTEVIVNFINEKLSSGRIDGAGGLSNKSVKDISSVLKMIIKYGASKGILSSSLIEFSVPKERRKDIKILNSRDLKSLESYVYDAEDSYKLGVYICLYTGLRIGEICALQWKDIDFANKTLKVRKTILRITDTDSDLSKTKIIIDSPKSESSIREIPLPNKLIDILQQHKSKILNEEYYVLTGNEKYIEPRNYYEKYKKYLIKCNIPNYTFHSLRHTFATRCVEIGFDPKTLSEILGHSDVKITLSRYVHPSMERKRVCMEKLFEVNI